MNDNTIESFKRKYVKNNDTEKLTAIPYKGPLAITPTFIVPEAKNILVCDILFVVEDSKKYKYILICVDAASNHMDAEGIFGTLSSNVVLQAFKKIIKRKNIDLPSFSVITDSGSEFRGEFSEFLNKKKIYHNRIISGRHSTMVKVDQYTLLVGRLINLVMTDIELEYKKNKKTNKKLKLTYSWIKLLPKIVKIYNSKKYIKPDMTEETIEKSLKKPLKISNYNRFIIAINTNVRIITEKPEDALGNKLHGSFRKMDIRYHTEIHKVAQIILNATQPVMYLVKNSKNKQSTTAYTKQQLQLI